jgi:hypothetical protein
MHAEHVATCPPRGLVRVAGQASARKQAVQSMVFGLIILVSVLER